MKPMQIAMALLSAVMFFILAGVFMGVQLELNGTKLVVDTAADIRWQWSSSVPRWSFLPAAASAVPEDG